MSGLARHDRQLIEDAYGYCLSMARSHYENFPVASRLIPAALRRPVAAIYAFARCADDFADEGKLTAETRLAKLATWEEKLRQACRGERGDDPIFIALQDSIATYSLPHALFIDLLTAFRMDVIKKRYVDFTGVLDYCRYSANPIGRLLLHLYGQATEDKLRQSDAVCSALQLLNFLQDIRQDYQENRRIYLPGDEMTQLGICEQDIAREISGRAMKQLINRQLTRISMLLQQGAPLAWRLPGRLGLELRLTVFGAAQILQKLATASNPYTRPRLSRTDYLQISWQSLFFKPATLNRLVILS